MGLFDKIKEMLGGAEEVDIGEVDQQDNEFISYSGSAEPRREREREVRETSSSSTEKRRSGGNIKSINATAQLNLALFKPERFGNTDEMRDIADHVNSSYVVVLNLETANEDNCRRILDFLSGVTYANKGNIQCVSRSTFIIIPSHVAMFGNDVIDQIENGGFYFDSAY